MKRTLPGTLLLSLVAHVAVLAQGPANIRERNPLPRRWNLRQPNERADIVRQLREAHEARRAEAVQWAQQRGVPTRYDDGRQVFEIKEIRDGRPLYRVTHNANAAISTAANLVRQTTPYNTDGGGVTAGVWDAGDVLTTHQEFGTRVTAKDSVGSHYHATHVGGTIGAAGLQTAAKGMAPVIIMDSYDWNSDSSEMADRGAAYPGEPGTIPISNHSYGSISGWMYTDLSGTWAYHWTPYQAWGDASTREANFGQYDYGTAAFDAVAYNAPYYLIFKSAGNDRNDNPPQGGTVYYTLNGGTTWNSVTYNSASHPPGDGTYKVGYDTIPHEGVAKNVMCVGAVNDAVSGGSRSLANAGMTSFSGWGPTDDGRIKPDIVANGNALYSADKDNNSDYTTLSGTSMSTPNACGSAALLVEYFSDRFAGHAMRASTLKGLIIHTADDLPSTGPDGPDYKYGWGLMDTKAAADHLRDFATSPANQKVIEGRLTTANASDTYTLMSDGSEPIRVTLCWTDPPGASTSGHDDTTSRLINDVDLTMVGPGAAGTYYPYVLDRANPSSPAMTGENDIDNVEQIYLASPGAGSYTIVVDYDGSLTDGEQWYSLLMSGGPQTVSGVAPAVTSLSPSMGANMLWITIEGSHFQLGASVKLSKPGESDIDATGEQVSPELIVAHVDVTGALPGLWNIVVTNPDSQSAMLASALEIPRYAESFETGFGIWQHSAGNDFNWTRRSGGTSSTGTGPDAASDGDYYIYMESSNPNFPNKTAAIESAHDFADVAAPTLMFDYHMYGASMGTLNLDAFDGTWHEGIWTRSGQQQTDGSGWSNAVVDLSSYGNTSGVTLRFRGITGGGYQSDMAVDNIRVGGDTTIQSVTLTVSSVYGMASPAAGTHTNVSGETVTCGITNAFVSVHSAQSTTVYTCTGWTGTGDVTPVGTGTNTGPMTLAADSTITWIWQVYDLFLSNRVVTAVETHTALNRVTAGENYQVDPGGRATLEAGQTVRLLPGFRAATGGVLRVRIVP